ncbi:MAG TPA: tetratricopeptide repeat protein [bacterium]
MLIKPRISISILLLCVALSGVALAAKRGDSEAAAQDNHSRAMDQFIRGTTADQVEDYYRAVFHYQEALRFDSTSAFIHVALAQDYALLGNSAMAVDLLDRALRIHSEYVPALELKALILRSSGKPNDARDALKKLVQIAPKKLEYLRELLSVELARRDYKEADRIYERIIQQGGESETLTRQVATIYLTSSQYDRAIPLLKKLVATDSTDAGLVYTLGTAYFQKGDTSAGEKCVLLANRLEPGEPRFWVGRALIAMDRQRFTEVPSIVDSALAHVKPQAGLYSLKGIALNRLGGHTKESIDALESAIRLDTTLYVAMGTLAMIYDGLDSLDRAVTLYEHAITLSDSAPIYLNNLAYTYASRGQNLDQAKKLVETALKAEPKNGAYLDTMGWIEYMLGHYDDAIDLLKKAAKETPDGADILEHLGDAYEKSGDHGKAGKMYRRALEKNPQNESLRRKLAH